MAKSFAAFPANDGLTNPWLSRLHRRLRFNLSDYLAWCGRNYLLLNKLLLNKALQSVEDSDEPTSVALRDVSGQCSIVIQSRKESRFSTYVELCQRVEGNTHWLDLDIVLRLQHDSKTADILGFRVGKAAQAGKNRVFLPQEKMRQAMFVSDWLTNMMRLGHLDETVYEFK